MNFHIGQIVDRKVVEENLERVLEVRGNPVIFADLELFKKDGTEYLLGKLSENKYVIYYFKKK